MTLFEIVALYIALNLFILLTLSYLVIKSRQTEKIIFGDGDNENMQRAIRVHGNFTEYAPMALIGLFALAGLGASPYVLHGLGAAFTIGRLMHAFGFSKATGSSFGRYYGTVITLLSLISITLFLIYQIVMH